MTCLECCVDMEEIKRDSFRCPNCGFEAEQLVMFRNSGDDRITFDNFVGGGGADGATYTILAHTGKGEIEHVRFGRKRMGF